MSQYPTLHKFLVNSRYNPARDLVAIQLPVLAIPATTNTKIFQSNYDKRFDDISKDKYS